jgi:integrase
MISRDIDPLDHKKAEATTKAILKEKETNKQTSFRQVALEYINTHRAEWKNAKHESQWRNTLETYVYPVFGDRPVSEIDETLVLKALNPIWLDKTETASRIRNRIELVLDLARFKKMREGENPARWKGYLEYVLPSPNKIKNEEHQPALPYTQIPEFIRDLRELNGTSSLCLEFTILTAIRSGTSRLATWDQIDEENKIWSPSAEIMKGSKEGHRVPLSDAAMIVLEKAKVFRTDSGLIFPGRNDKPLSDMSLTLTIRRMNEVRDLKKIAKWVDPTYSRTVVPHGFRSTFRDWGAETTTYPHELQEIALAHSVGNKVELAYRRGDMFDKRRAMMEDWARYCSISNANVRSINEKPRTAA